jgi:hypothetical protein
MFSESFRAVQAEEKEGLQFKQTLLDWRKIRII